MKEDWLMGGRENEVSEVEEFTSIRQRRVGNRVVSFISHPCTVTAARRRALSPGSCSEGRRLLKEQS
jgi:hypothetical protein